MADIKISQLGEAAVVTDSDVFPMVANGVTVKTPADILKEYTVGDSDISSIGDGSVTGAISTDHTMIQRILGDFADVEATTTASRAYKVGECLVMEGLLYVVTTAIASGDTIVVSTNVDQTTVSEIMANKILDFGPVTVQAGTGNLATVTDAHITADHIVAGRSILWGNASAITSEVTVTTSAGQAVIAGTCTTATTATFTLIRKDN